MMKYLATLMVLFIGVMSPAQVMASNGISWQTNYETAIADSRTSGKPVILFFTGSDWCTWCTKLEKEVLDTAEFGQLTKDKYIFVKVDFPLNNPLPADLTTQNKELQKRFSVRSFPTLVIINSNGEQIGTTGYRAGGAKAYAEHLESIVGDHSSYQSRLGELDRLSTAELKKLYTKAQELGRTGDAIQILKAGIATSDNHFFLIERYRLLADQGLNKTKEAAWLKKEVLEADPDNLSNAHYSIAVIDFECACEELECQKIGPELAVAPLVNYIDRYGSRDPDNLWRLEMIISQIYFDKGDLNASLKYAERSYHSAPDSVRPDIETAISNIRASLN